MTEEQKNNLELTEALKAFDPVPAGDPQIPEEPEPEKQEPQPEHLEAGDRPGDHMGAEDRKEEHLQAGDQPDEEPLDWTDTKAVIAWYGRLVLKLSRRKESLARLRAVSGALSTLASLIRLNADTAELAQIKAELNDLRRQIEGERIGPRGIVK